jgi:hypothetical protein
MALASGSPYALLVEVTGKADWIDVTFFALRFGLPRTYLREVATAFPLNGFYPIPAWPMVADHAAVDEVVPFELALDGGWRPRACGVRSLPPAASRRTRREDRTTAEARRRMDLLRRDR